MRDFAKHSGFFEMALVSLLAVGCGSEKSSNQGGSDPDFTEFDATVSQFLTDHGLSGASAAIVQKDRGIVHTKGYGEFTPDRIYLVMSSSKILSAGILLRLDDRGVIDIDAPIGNYVSSWGAGKPELTVAQLISGSSGLVGIVDNALYAPYSCQMDAGTTLTGCAGAIYTANDGADIKPPDTEFHYGGAAWQLAGGVAEVASGKSWADLVNETYVVPCNAPSMGFTNALLMSSVTVSDGGLGVVSYPTTVHGDTSMLPVTQNPSIEGGLYTNVTDYAKILLMHLRGGKCDSTQVLSEAAVSKMQEDRILSYGGSTALQMSEIVSGADATTREQALRFAGYGMGWWVDRVEPGVVIDPGAYGSDAWLDVPRGYGAFIAIEGNVTLGAELLGAVVPVAGAAFDAAR